eukprot:3996896-Pyramimonas_sp.AAC.1
MGGILIPRWGRHQALGLCAPAVALRSRCRRARCTVQPRPAVRLPSPVVVVLLVSPRPRETGAPPRGLPPAVAVPSILSPLPRVCLQGRK